MKNGETLKAYGLAAFLFLAALTPARAADLVLNLQWEDDHVAVSAALEGACRKTSTVTVEPPQFPLARDLEQHLLCHGLKIGEREVEKAAFVLADNKLQLIELRGGATKAFRLPEEEAVAQRYMHYDVYNDGALFLDASADIVWFISAEARHPNLFTWKNPLLNKDQQEMPRYTAGAELPSFIAFGSGFGELKPQMEAACPLIHVQEIEPPSLPTEPQSQTQINCFGYDYAGFPRKFEAVFGDGKLLLVWILTAAGEEGRVRQALIEEYGQPVRVTEDWEVFEGGEIALRKDKPEVLAIAPEFVPLFTARIGSD